MKDLDRYQITKILNNYMIGFLEGSMAGLCDSVARRLEIPVTDVRVIAERLENPPRYCWSIHVDHGEQHYESIIRNLQYDTGWE